jgi:hypothetical protein
VSEAPHVTAASDVARCPEPIATLVAAVRQRDAHGTADEGEHRSVSAARAAAHQAREAAERTRTAKAEFALLQERVRRTEAATAGTEARLADTLRDLAATAIAQGRRADAERLLREVEAAEQGARQARGAADD